MPTLKLLESSVVVREYIVHDFRQWGNGSYFKISATLIDGSMLHIREYASETERMYSFHWQSYKSDLLLRWDNAPHHSDIETFPHHWHRQGNVVPSNEITLQEVLRKIEGELT